MVDCHVSFCFAKWLKDILIDWGDSLILSRGILMLQGPASPPWIVTIICGHGWSVLRTLLCLESRVTAAVEEDFCTLLGGLEENTVESYKVP